MGSAKIVGLEAASRRAGVSPEAVRLWCIKFPDLGVMVKGVWHIDADALNTIIQARATLAGAS